MTGSRDIVGRVSTPAPLALITGASSGIGAEFARQLATIGYGLVIVARDLQRLDALASELRDTHGITVQTIAADLTTNAGIARVERRIADADEPGVTMLINNAGFGLRGDFEANTIADELGHLAILVEAPMRLSHAALAPMLERGSGTIITVASLAAYTPRGTYGAAKSWVISFSRWANIRYRPRGVTVTAVAPGFVATEFQQRMGMSTEGIPRFLWLSPERVVRSALGDAARGKAISIPSLRYKLVAAVVRILPARVAAGGSLREL